MPISAPRAQPFTPAKQPQLVTVDFWKSRFPADAQQLSDLGGDEGPLLPMTQPNQVLLSDEFPDPAVNIPAIAATENVAGEVKKLIIPTTAAKKPITRQHVAFSLYLAEHDLCVAMGLTVDAVVQGQNGIYKGILVRLQKCICDVARYDMDYFAARKDGKERCDECREWAKEWNAANLDADDTVSSIMSAFAV